jgi:hypothetical protein
LKAKMVVFGLCGNTDMNLKVGIVTLDEAYAKTLLALMDRAAALKAEIPGFARLVLYDGACEYASNAKFSNEDEDEEFSNSSISFCSGKVRAVHRALEAATGSSEVHVCDDQVWWEASLDGGYESSSVSAGSLFRSDLVDLLAEVGQED